MNGLGQLEVGARVTRDGRRTRSYVNLEIFSKCKFFCCCNSMGRSIDTLIIYLWEINESLVILEYYALETRWKNK